MTGLDWSDNKTLDLNRLHLFRCELPASLYQRHISELNNPGLGAFPSIATRGNESPLCCSPIRFKSHGIHWDLRVGSDCKIQGGFSSYVISCLRTEQWHAKTQVSPSLCMVGSMC